MCICAETNQLKFFLALLLCCCLAACAKTLDFELPERSQLALIIQDGGNTAVSRRSLSESQYQELARWFENNQAGWESSPASYVPRVVVSGGEVSINFLGDFVIVNIPGGQFTKPIAPRDYEYLLSENT